MSSAMTTNDAHLSPSPVPEEETWFGRSVSRREDRPLVTGTGRYVADIDIPGTLDIAFVRSPVAHGRIIGLNVERARALDGVVAVFTAADIAGHVAPFTRFVDQEHTPPGLAQAVGPRVRPCPIEVLAGDVVRFVGQALVAVVAKNRYVAEDACDVVEVDYEELAAVVDVERAIQADSPTVHASIPGNVQADFEVTAGDPDAAFAVAENTLKVRIHSQRVTAHPMETRGVLATVDQLDGGLTVWSSTQVPYMVRTRIAEQLGLSEQSVRVVAPEVGGGFGPKVQVYPEEVLLAHISRTMHATVRWIEDRREHMLSTGQARDQVHSLEVAFDNDGLITAMRDDFLLDCGAYNPFSITVAYNTAAHLRTLYKVPHLRVRSQCVLTNKVYNVPYRGAGRPEGAFAMDRVVYEVARKLRLAPVEVLRRNLIGPEQMPYHRGMPYRDGNEIVYDCGDFIGAFDQLKELARYDEHKSQQAELRKRGVYRGIGFATYIEGTGIGPFESASVGLNSTGQVAVMAGCAPQGQSHHTVLSQIVADVLGIQPDEIEVRTGDTSLLPYGRGTFASRSAVTAGTAAMNSAVRLKSRLLAIAGEMLEISVEDLHVSGGSISVRGNPGSSLTFAQIYTAASPGPAARLPIGVNPGTVESDFWVPPTVTFGSGMQAAIVEVDIETGFVHVEKMIVMHDCGRMINPLVVEGQIDGGVVQGIGAALYEEIVHDSQGQPLTTTLMDYLLPTATEIPPIEQVHLEYVSDRNPLGIKGVGEAGTISPPAAIANAVVDALADEFDPDIFRLPLSPAALMKAMYKGRQSPTNERIPL
jgi:carbon-monoxide dehydrogenase large subunit